jgi:ketosteroid isomerase-like protein
VPRHLVQSRDVAGRDLDQLARRFFGSYADGDLETARSLMADDVVSYVTNAEAGVDRLEGRDAFVNRLPDLTGADLQVGITQVVVIDDERVLTMIEIRARRGDATLHNFAAFLARVAGEQITELWMVDAKPAGSDEFWA